VFKLYPYEKQEQKTSSFYYVSKRWSAGRSQDAICPVEALRAHYMSHSGHGTFPLVKRPPMHTGRQVVLH
jgi:hypothetical protein